MSRADELLEAHVAFELAALRGKALADTISDEVTAFQGWAAQLRLDQLTSAAEVNATVRRLVLEGAVPEELTAMIADTAKQLIALPVNADTRLGDVIDDEIFDAGITLAVQLRGLREEVLRSSLHSPLFALLVTDILYHGIRDYLVGENLLSQKLPGVSSLLSRGAGAINKRLPKLEGKIEERVRAYIESNMGATVAQSEKFLLGAMTDARIRELTGEVWRQLRDSHLSVAELLADEEVDAAVAFGREFWLHLRQTDYLHSLIDDGVDGFFERHGADSLASLLEQVGVDAAVLEREAQQIVPRLIAAADEGGALEALLRRRLGAFYRSRTARKLLKA